MENYIADKKVLAISVLEDIKTPAKNEMVKVMFEDGTEEIMPKRRYEMIVTPTISDASSVQTKIQNHVGSYLFGTLHEFGIKMGEVENILNATSDFVNGGYVKARNIKWGYEHEFLPLIEVNNVLLENNAKQDNNGTTSDGSGTDTQN